MTTIGSLPRKYRTPDGESCDTVERTVRRIHRLSVTMNDAEGWNAQSITRSDAMLMKAKQRKRTKAGGVCSDSEKTAADHGGDYWCDHEVGLAPSKQRGDDPKGDTETSAVCREIQSLQRYRVTMLKMRNMIDNSLRAAIAQHLGYSSGMEEAERKKMFAEADKVIKRIESSEGTGAGGDDERIVGLVLSTRVARNGYDAQVKACEKAMGKLAKQLPAADWVQTIRGFGIGNFSFIVGECGDLSNYANPAKVWKRLGLAPYQGKMPSTWRRTGGLSAEQWGEAGYSPRRRAVAYLLSTSVMNMNKGEYRARYDAVKAEAAAKHPDWAKDRCHKHALLLTAKRLVRDLWCKWHGKEPQHAEAQVAAHSGMLEPTNAGAAQ
jgi:hypothetical protein